MTIHFNTLCTAARVANALTAGTKSAARTAMVPEREYVPRIGPVLHGHVRPDAVRPARRSTDRRIASLETCSDDDPLYGVDPPPHPPRQMITVPIVPRQRADGPFSSTALTGPASRPCSLALAPAAPLTSRSDCRARRSLTGLAADPPARAPLRHARQVCLSRRARCLPRDLARSVACYAHRAHRPPRALARSPELVNPPVGLMFLEGAPLLAAGVRAPGMHDGDRRVAIEAYRAAARRITSASCKSDERLASRNAGTPCGTQADHRHTPTAGPVSSRRRVPTAGVGRTRTTPGHARRRQRRSSDAALALPGAAAPWPATLRPARRDGSVGGVDRRLRDKQRSALGDHRLRTIDDVGAIHDPAQYGRLLGMAFASASSGGTKSFAPS